MKKVKFIDMARWKTYSMRKKVTIITLILIGVFVIYAITFGTSTTTVVVYPAIIENPDEEIVEMDLKLIGKFEAEDEEYVAHSKETMMRDTLWWQSCTKDSYEIITKRLGLDEIDYDFDHKNYSYIFSYGRPLKSLCCNKTLEYAQGGYGVEYEFDMETPYESNVVYIYETDDYYLVDIEWI